MIFLWHSHIYHFRDDFLNVNMMNQPFSKQQMHKTGTRWVSAEALCTDWAFSQHWSQPPLFEQFFTITYILCCYRYFTGNAATLINVAIETTDQKPVSLVSPCVSTKACQRRMLAQFGGSRGSRGYPLTGIILWAFRGGQSSFSSVVTRWCFQVLQPSLLTRFPTAT